MAQKKYSEFSKSNVETLKNDLREAQARLESSKLEHNIKGLQNPTELRMMRREIARIQTALRSNELSQLTAK
ncbi:MAG TPA: 50S ribosomal protein L29 [Saprospiraceae bacterium]|nr:50S ribosomal protein L29 [Saprospiraceae bacterium]